MVCVFISPLCVCARILDLWLKSNSDTDQTECCRHQDYHIGEVQFDFSPQTEEGCARRHPPQPLLLNHALSYTVASGLLGSVGFSLSLSLSLAIKKLGSNVDPSEVKLNVK